MSVIKAKLVEVEIQEQKMDEPGCKYMIAIRYMPLKHQSNELLNIILTDEKPVIRETMDLGDKVVDKNVATTKKPADITTPEELLGLRESGGMWTI